MKIYFRKCYGRYNTLLQHYNTPLSQSLVILLIPRRVRGHNRWSLILSSTYPQTWVLRVSVLSWVHITFIPGIVVIMDSWYLISGWRTVISFPILFLLDIDLLNNSKLNYCIIHRLSLLSINTFAWFRCRATDDGLLPETICCDYGLMIFPSLYYTQKSDNLCIIYILISCGIYLLWNKLL